MVIWQYNDGVEWRRLGNIWCLSPDTAALNKRSHFHNAAFICLFFTELLFQPFCLAKILLPAKLIGKLIYCLNETIFHAIMFYDNSERKPFTHKYKAL